MIPHRREKPRSIRTVIRSEQMGRIEMLQMTVLWRRVFLYPKPQRGRARLLRPEVN